MPTATATMKAVQAPQPGKPLELIEKEIPQPRPGQVRVKVHACGICHSDEMVIEGHWPGIKYPRCPGHEIAGEIDELGAGVLNWKKGQRVGVGWCGGYCGECAACRRGDFILCSNMQITGFSFDGGYQQYVVVPTNALAPIPKELSFEEAAPILCAGITTYNALRNSSARPGDLVAIQGIGGLGHLGVQFANKMGFRTVAISKGKDKETLAKKLGAHFYLDYSTVNPAEALMKLGGAKVILATAPNSKSISPLVDGLGPRGELIVVGASPEAIEVTPLQLIGMSRTVRGWAGGSPADSEDTLNFCALTGIRPIIETFPLEKASDALKRTLTNQVRFRSVLVHNG